MFFLLLLSRSEAGIIPTTLQYTMHINNNVDVINNNVQITVMNHHVPLPSGNSTMRTKFSAGLKFAFLDGMNRI
jgi:hypothetical protein